MTYTVEIYENEHFWGGTTIHKMCPITKESAYSQDFRRNCPNQVMPLFVSDQGRYIWSDAPFKVEVKEGRFEFEGGEINLVQAGTTLKDAFKAAQAAHFPCDQRELRPEFFKTAQYNTWMEFTYYPTQEGVLEYAREWIQRGYEPGIFIIDEGWHEHTAYGTWEFDFARFPDPKKMVDELHQMGYIVMLWVVPFVSPVGPQYVRSLRPLAGTDPESAKHIYMRTGDNEVAMTKWWNGNSAILDFTNPYDEKFLDDQLRHLMKDYGIDGFKFDGGTIEHYHPDNIINGKLRSEHTPHELNKAWNEFGRRYPFHEYKDTYQGGGKNVIQRLHDRAHAWEGNGIDDILPCAIVNGLIGHPFICPDMIGGGEWSTRYLPGFQVDEELFVRMAQIAALFPMMQFSWAPWKAVSGKYQNCCLDAAKLHSRLSKEILELVKEAEKTGEPLVRCLEYNDPHQGYAEIRDEFMLGEKFLVAPVVTKGTYQREVVFPEGIWEDEDGNRYEGRTKAVMDAPVEKLLWFRRIVMEDTSSVSSADTFPSRGRQGEDPYSIHNTTKEQRIELIKSWTPEDEAMDENDVDLWEMYRDYIDGKKEIRECNEAFASRTGYVIG